MNENLSGITTSRRRGFLAGAAVAAGSLCSIGQWIRPAAAATPAPAVPKADRLPREVCIATLSLHGLRADSLAQRTKQVLALMREIAPQQPDVICLPETVSVANVSTSIPELAQRAEEGIGKVAVPYAEFASEHNCYVVCPIHTKRDDRFYNSALFIDRQGKLIGEYHKIHPTTGEMESGLSPGPLRPNVVETDFGRVGAQICYDIEWQDGWNSLADSGAEIVFWPSAFAGGAMVNAKAWQHQYCVVSSTWKNTSKICDVAGEELAKTSHWNQWCCASVNLEKAFLHTWPYVQRFGDILAKYGRDIRITNHAEEEWSILESRSPDIRIADILKEFELKSIRDHLGHAESIQDKNR